MLSSENPTMKGGGGLGGGGRIHIRRKTHDDIPANVLHWSDVGEEG